jgi:predicted aldo/keto reductase-like oxidoreductase
LQFRRFGKLDFSVSALGFGAMRLPQKDGKIDEETAQRMLYYAIDHGVNYVDTAYTYHGGESEVFLGKALTGGYREKVKLATKLPCWLVKGPDDFDKYLNEQLMRLQADCVDFYLLHSLNREKWLRLRDLGVLNWAEKAKKDGRFKYLGFSFHDDGETFKQIVDAYDWDMCQIQYNFIDVENQAGTEGLRYAAGKGIPVVVMEPLLGGKLADPPAPIQSIWDQAAQKRLAIDWALRWLWHQPEVAVVLSGMSSMEQVQQNVAFASDPGYDALNEAELALYGRVRDTYKTLTAIPCTNCRYCMPCPHHVDIPGNFKAYNEGVAYEKPDAARGQYDWWRYSYEELKLVEHDIRALNCVGCGECEEKCPQGIPIRRWIAKVHEVLGEGKPFVVNLE